METTLKVYAVTLDGTINPTLCNDDQFIHEAKKEGLVWTLQSFVENFNAGVISDEFYIRVI
jgi:hypothetical protein